MFPWYVTVNRDLFYLFIIDNNYCVMRKYVVSIHPLTDTTIFGGSCQSNRILFEDAAAFFCGNSADNFYIADNSKHRLIYFGQSQ